MPPDDKSDAFTAEQLAFLVRFAENSLRGRTFLCWLSRCIIAVGTLVGIVAGAYVALNQALTGR